MQTQWCLYSHHSSLVTTQITNSSYLLNYSTSQMAKALVDIYEGIVKTTVGGALWFLFCYVYLVWGSYYRQNLGLCTCWASTLRLSHTCRSQMIFLAKWQNVLPTVKDKLTLCAPWSGAGKKKKTTIIPLALFLIKLNNFRKTRKTLIYHLIITIIKPACFQDEVTKDEKDWGPVLQETQYVILDRLFDSQFAILSRLYWREDVILC